MICDSMRMRLSGLGKGSQRGVTGVNWVSEDVRVEILLANLSAASLAQFLAISRTVKNISNGIMSILPRGERETIGRPFQRTRIKWFFSLLAYTSKAIL